MKTVHVALAERSYDIVIVGDALVVCICSPANNAAPRTIERMKICAAMLMEILCRVANAPAAEICRKP